MPSLDARRLSAIIRLAAGAWLRCCLLGLQIGLRLVAQDVNGLESGPLNHLVSYDTAEAAREWHQLLFNVILDVVALHVAAILYYRVIRRDYLVKPMITGRKDMGGVAEQPRKGSTVAMVLCALAAFGFMWWIWLGAGEGILRKAGARVASSQINTLAFVSKQI